MSATRHTRLARTSLGRNEAHKAVLSSSPSCSMGMFHFGLPVRLRYLPNLRWMATSTTASSKLERFLMDAGPQLAQSWRQTPRQPPSSLQKYPSGHWLDAEHFLEQLTPENGGKMSVAGASHTGDDSAEALTKSDRTEGGPFGAMCA